MQTQSLMTYSPAAAPPRGARRRPAPRRRWALSAAEEVVPVVEAVVALLKERGYGPKDVFAVRLALEEALVNALKHGHRYDPAKRARVQCRVDSRRVVLLVQDQGEGFDPGRVRDPLSEENLEQPGGRGLLLMRHYLSGVRYNARGNAVALRKVRTGA